jgi:hypothetical protein
MDARIEAIDVNCFGPREGRTMIVERLLRSLRLRSVPSLLVIVALGSSALRLELAGAQDVTATAPVLSGRIMDEDGQPVTDARIQIVYVESGAQDQEARTTRTGKYSLQRVNRGGAHKLMISSDRCLGFTQFNECPVVVLDPTRSIVRDFVLKRACQVRVQALDEDGHPVPNVQFFMVNGQFPTTDQEGWATIGGLNPSLSEATFGVYHADFEMARLHVKLADPKTIVERKIVMRRGVDVKGTALCSDGKPAAGWHINALPGWWDFMAYPTGELINGDGSFVLHHVAPGAHNVSISIPLRQGASTSRSVFQGVDLASQHGPLVVKLDYPSPGALAQIEGRIRYIGEAPKRGFWVQADSDDGRSFHGGDFVRAGEKIFRIGSLPAGRYRLDIRSPEIEPQILSAVTAPVKDLQLEIKVRGLLSVHGVVVSAEGSDRKPLAEFRVRVVKLRTLHGPNTFSTPGWRRITADDGQFTEELPGPGVYVVEAAADGYATSRSEAINTDNWPPKEIRIGLTKGIPLAGTVVDGEGRPISGATVISLAQSGGQRAVSTANLPERIGIKTVAGHFRFAGLDPGMDTLYVVHPEYAPVIVSLSIQRGSQPPLAIVMPRGGAVCGHVQDPSGRLAAGVTLHFEDSYASGADPRNGRFATAVTDENGYYEVSHLPERLVFIHRADEWDALGVVRQTVLPANGKRRTVDFGGSSKISGQLFVNGRPLSNQKVLMSGVNPNFGIMKAFAKTDTNGAFTFLGIPFGNRYLYYTDGGQFFNWHRVRELRIDSVARNFGRIEHHVGKVTVILPPVAGAPRSTVWATLEDATAGPFRGQFVTYAAPRSEKDAPYLFENIPNGKYTVIATLGEALQVRKIVETTPEKRDLTVSVELPKGTASLHGTLDRSLRKDGRYSSIELRAPNDALRFRSSVNEGGSFDVTGLPEGDYSLTIVRTVANNSTSEAAGKVSLRKGEARTMQVSKESVEPSKSKEGMLFVTVVTGEGLPLPGFDLRLTGPKGTLLPKGINDDGRAVFVGPPGTYDLTATYLGFKPGTQRVELSAAQANRRNPHEYESTITLSPID